MGLGAVEMMHRRLRGQSLLLSLLLLIGCSLLVGRRPVACPDLIDAPLRDLDFDQVDRESFRVWVSTTYRLPQNQVVVEARYTEDSPSTGRSPLTETIKWEAGGKLYFADFVGSELRRIQLRWDTFTPTAEDVIRCWGTPESYVAYSATRSRSNRKF